MFPSEYCQMPVSQASCSSSFGVPISLFESLEIRNLENTGREFRFGNWFAVTSTSGMGSKGLGSGERQHCPCPQFLSRWWWLFYGHLYNPWGHSIPQHREDFIISIEIMLGPQIQDWGGNPGLGKAMKASQKVIVEGTERTHCSLMLMSRLGLAHQD